MPEAGGAGSAALDVAAAADRQLEDDRLVAAARTDRAAFAPLYRAYVRPVYRFFVHQVGDRQEAEDLTATTFGKALASLDRYQAAGTFAAWLFSIARHTLGDYRRRRRPRVAVEVVAPLLIAAEGQPEAEALEAERLRRLAALLRQLPADQQEALALRFFAGLNGAQAAAVLGRRDGALRMLVHRAITTLRRQLAQEEDDA